MDEKKRAMLEETQLFVLDMDGTFFMGQSVIEGALDFIEEVKRRKKKFLFFTNNSSRTSESYMEKFSGSGCPINRSQIMTSGDVAVRYLHTEFSGASVYLLGTPSLEESMRAAGITLTEEAPDVVLVAFDKTLTYEKLEKGCTFIREGAAYLATHPDVNCPVPGGFIPDCGAICSAISLSTGRFPKYLGKPYEETVKMIFEHTRVPVSQLLWETGCIRTLPQGLNMGREASWCLPGKLPWKMWKRQNISRTQSLLHWARWPAV